MSSTQAVTPAAMEESPIDPAQALAAAQALVEYIKKTSKNEVAKSGKRNLLADGDGDDADAADTLGADTPILLTISTKRHILDSDSRRLQPCRIAVPYALNGAGEEGKDGDDKDAADGDDSTICLITADPQRAYKNLVADEAFPAALRQRITRVVDVAHLAKKFRAYEAQRQLFAAHDVFLGDARIINRLPKLLGKTFYKTTSKRPVPVVLARRKTGDEKKDKTKKTKTTAASAADLDEQHALAVERATASARSPALMAAEIRRALSAAVVHLAPTASTSVRVGRAGWPAAHVAANIEAVCRALVARHVPQGWRGVRAVFLKGPRTMALPVWQTDELWVDGGDDVLKTGSAALAAYEARQTARRERANVGKKRKADAEAADKDNAVADKPAKRKTLPASHDGGLDKQIAAHKEKLKKQKKAAKQAMEV